MHFFNYCRSSGESWDEYRHCQYRHGVRSEHGEWTSFCLLLHRLRDLGFERRPPWSHVFSESVGTSSVEIWRMAAFIQHHTSMGVPVHPRAQRSGLCEARWRKRSRVAFHYTIIIRSAFSFKATTTNPPPSTREQLRFNSSALL